MEYGIFIKPVVTIYDEPVKIRETEFGTLSNISDEALYGMACQVTESDGVRAHVITHYGYAGYVEMSDIMLVGKDEVCAYLGKNLMVVDKNCADVLSAPTVHGVNIISLTSGCLVEVIEGEEEDAWSKVKLADGRCGYIRTQFLEEKRFGEDFLWRDPKETLEILKGVSEKGKDASGGQEGFDLKKLLDKYYGGSLKAFQSHLVEEAKKYLGVQYRWGAKSGLGIDCSGLVSMSYMRSGVLIYRDAVIADGFPLRRVPIKDLEQGDAIFFPGHVAMYIGDGRYIHSTAHAGSGGVVINSLVKGEADYREDLVKIMYAAGRVQI